MRSLRKQFIQQLEAPSDGTRVAQALPTQASSGQLSLAWPFQRQTAQGLKEPFTKKGVEREERGKYHAWADL